MNIISISSAESTTAAAAATTTTVQSLLRLRSSSGSTERSIPHPFYRMLQTGNGDGSGGSGSTTTATTTTSTQTTQSCAPPPPQNTSHYNPNTNETMYYETQVEVHEIGMIYYYEIHHAEGVSWEASSGGSGDNTSGGDGGEEGSVSGTIGDWIDTAQNFFGGLFDESSSSSDGGQQQDDGTGEEEGGEDDTNNIGGGNAKLTRLETYMAKQVWNNALNDERMTWSDDNENDDDDDGSEEECAGLVIDDETTSATVEEEITKLLGLTHEPLDYVNPEGELFFHVMLPHLVHFFGILCASLTCLILLQYALFVCSILHK